MAMLTLSRVWLNSAADLMDSIELREANQVTGESAVDGSTKTYASGRRRGVKTRAEPRSWQITVQGLTRADWLDLEARKGRLHLLRMPTGLAAWGVFWSIQLTEWVTVDLVDAQLTFEEHTYTVAV